LSRSDAANDSFTAADGDKALERDIGRAHAPQGTFVVDRATHPPPTHWWRTVVVDRATIHLQRTGGGRSSSMRQPSAAGATVEDVRDT
jgi:hypothetical protein